MYSNRYFNENDFNLNKVEGYSFGSFTKDIGGLVKDVGKAGGGLIRETGTAGGTIFGGVGKGVGSVFGGIGGGISGIFSSLFWPIILIAGIVTVVVLWNLLAEDPGVKARRLEREEDRAYERQKVLDARRQEEMQPQFGLPPPPPPPPLPY